jgi:adenylosuccinate synthase
VKKMGGADQAEGRAVAVVGLGFGDEGKGSVVDALARRRETAAVVRFNGGPQAAHHVVDAAGRVHCFSQFGAASLAGPARTFLGPEVLVDLPALEREADALGELGERAALGRVTLDERCVLVTPFHRVLNRLQELARGAGRHGSCGRGVGQARLDSRNPSMPTLRAGELRDAASMRKKLRFLQLVKLDQAEQLLGARGGLELDDATARALAELGDPAAAARVGERFSAVASGLAAIDDGSALSALLSQAAERVVFEGAQGVLLDEERGFFPHVTPSHTTFQGAHALLAAATGAPPALRLGLLRAYATRHGEGPFVGHDPGLTELLPEAHNVPNPWQGPMRCGWVDTVALRYAIAVAGGVDALAITCLDRLAGWPSVGLCVGYRLEGPEPPGLDELFDLERSSAGVVATGIRLPPSGGQPGSAAEEFAAELAALLSPGVPVLLSAGPTAADKRWLGGQPWASGRSSCGQAPSLD